MPRHDPSMAHRKLDVDPGIGQDAGMRILGVDPGTLVAGFGVVEQRGNRLVGVEAEAVKLGRGKPLPERLRRLAEAMRQIMGRCQVDAVAVEEVFFAKHPNAALKLGHARGVVLLVAAEHDLPVFEYPPAVVKRTVAGRGSAQKEQVAHLALHLLGWGDRNQIPSLDATDALALAITHAQARHFHAAAGAGLSASR